MSLSVLLARKMTLCLIGEKDELALHVSVAVGQGLLVLGVIL